MLVVKCNFFRIASSSDFKLVFLEALDCSSILNIGTYEAELISSIDSVVSELKDTSSNGDQLSLQSFNYNRKSVSMNVSKENVSKLLFVMIVMLYFVNVIIFVVLFLILRFRIN